MRLFGVDSETKQMDGDLKKKSNNNNLFLLAGEISLPTRELTPTQTAHYTAAALPSVVTAKPRRVELARILKVGDRVRRGPDWPSFVHLVSLLLLQ